MEQIFIKLHGSQSTQWAIIVRRKMKAIYFSLSLDSFTCISSLKNQLQIPKAYSLCSIIPKGNLFGIGSLCPSISPSSHTSIRAFSRETLLFENCGHSFSYEGFWVSHEKEPGRKANSLDQRCLGWQTSYHLRQEPSPRTGTTPIP